MHIFEIIQNNLQLKQIKRLKLKCSVALQSPIFSKLFLTNSKIYPREHKRVSRLISSSLIYFTLSSTSHHTAQSKHTQTQHTCHSHTQWVYSRANKQKCTPYKNILHNAPGTSCTIFPIVASNYSCIYTTCTAQNALWCRCWSWWQQTIFIKIARQCLLERMSVPFQPEWVHARPCQAIRIGRVHRTSHTHAMCHACFLRAPNKLHADAYA